MDIHESHPHVRSLHNLSIVKANLLLDNSGKSTHTFSFPWNRFSGQIKQERRYRNT